MTSLELKFLNSALSEIVVFSFFFEKSTIFLQKNMFYISLNGNDTFEKYSRVMRGSLKNGPTSTFHLIFSHRLRFVQRGRILKCTEK